MKGESRFSIFSSPPQKRKLTCRRAFNQSFFLSFPTFCIQFDDDDDDDKFLGNGQGEIEPFTYATRMADLKTYSEEFARRAGPSAATLQEGKARKLRREICAELKIRQVEKPPIGALCEYVEICVLHVALIAWHDWFAGLLKYTKLRLADAFGEEPMRSILEVLSRIGCGNVRLVLVRTGKPPRFVGNVVHNMSNEFTQLMHALWPFMARITDAKKRMELNTELLFFHVTGLYLRRITALMSQTTATEEGLDELEREATKFHNLKVLVRQGEYNTRNDFTVGKIIPYRARQFFDRLGVGLGTYLHIYTWSTWNYLHSTSIK